MHIRISRIIAPEIEYEELEQKHLQTNFFTCFNCAFIIYDPSRKPLCPNCKSTKFREVFYETAFWVIYNVSKQDLDKTDIATKELSARMHYHLQSFLALHPEDRPAEVLLNDLLAPIPAS